MKTEDARACRGIRGAITIAPDGYEALREATLALLDGLVAANGCLLEDIAAAIFTIPEELAGANPAAIARQHGWSSIPFLMVKEHGGDTRIDRCLRVLLMWNTTRRQAEVRHLYLRGAAALRADLSAGAAAADQPT